MTAPPLDQFHDPFDERYDQVAVDPPYLAPDLPTPSQNQSMNAQQRIEELEMVTFAALQAQADMEYCLEVEERRRRRLEEPKNPTVFMQPVIIDRVVRTPVVVESSFMSSVWFLKAGLCLGILILLGICLIIVLYSLINRN
ncbi:unnamed protein product, partial [Mesorhabditis belari]|uniref:Uncharacterized protein n=1 Tax=Mesorhabditis belari TaxID=2138241 RepID=A0AAF3F0L4_9BILA